MMDGVHEADLDVWRAIDHGERQIDWQAWFGCSEAADYLTAEGKQTMLRAVADLATFFGSTWLDQAIRPDLTPHGPRIPALGASSPVLAPIPERRAGAYVESIRWWASLQLLGESRVKGYNAVRRDARHDLTAHRLMHALTQARLAAMGAYLGATVALEPGKSGGPGDVLLQSAGHEVFLEVVTFGPDETREMDERHQQRHWFHLMEMERDNLHWDGYVPGFLRKADEARWLQATREAAAECLRTGRPVEIPGPDGQRLIVRHDEQNPGTRTHGPYLDLDFSAKLASILDKKGAQTHGAGIAWIWIEDYGGVHPLHPLIRSPLGSQITQLAELVRPALAGRPHVAGAVWSRVEKYWPPPLPPDETAQDDKGFAFQRALPIEHVRRTVILNRSLILPDQTRVLAHACNREPLWLDWALKQLGVMGGVRSLLSQPPQARPSSLWTPTRTRLA
jgi:hypothetical protein